jgi:predicted nucleic-acid-binding Zn-ribbon protein
MASKGLAEGVCPKCNGASVRKEEAVLHGESGVWSFKSIEVITFICDKCGFMELYYKGKSIWK